MVNGLTVWAETAKLITKNASTKPFFISIRIKDSTIAFVTAAVQACLLMEKCSEYEVEEWREQMLRLLPVLYLRTRLVEQEEPMLDEEPQRFVTEEDYNYALVGIRNLLGQDDAYLDVFVDRGIYTDEVQTAYALGLKSTGDRNCWLFSARCTR